MIFYSNFLIKERVMKKLMLFFMILLVAGGAIVLLFNLLKFIPLNFEGNDPNSNFMLVGLAYLLVGFITVGANENPGNLNMVQQFHYYKSGRAEDVDKQNSRFLVAIVFIASGVLFVVSYLVLNRLLRP